MARPANFNYDKKQDGTPTASHIWEEQFFTAGHKGPPPIDDLKKRIKQLEEAMEKRPEHPARWSRELEWRKTQLSRQEDTDVRDTESEE